MQFHGHIIYITQWTNSVQSLTPVWLFATQWTAACQASLSIQGVYLSSQSLPKLSSIESVMPSHHLILCHPLFLLRSIFPSIRVFSKKSVLHIRWPKDWSFSFQHQSFQWIFKTDFLQDWWVGSPCSPRNSQESSPTPQFKASVLWCSALFIVQLSHPYLTTGKTIALTRRTFVSKVMSLLYNMLSRLVTAFLPRSKHLLISMASLYCSLYATTCTTKEETVMPLGCSR